MRWPPEKAHKWYIESDQGYTVSKMLSLGAAKYTAWAPPRQGTDRWIGLYDTPEQAQAACEDHSKKLNPKA